MSKQVEREEARRLRRQGLPVTEICRRLGVSKSSVSVWVRDIPLSVEQELALRRSSRRRKAQLAGSRANAEKHHQRRMAYQEEGRRKAREGDPLHLAGCMLYWAEGRKTGKALVFSNSDPDMLILYLRFLRESLLISSSEIALHVNCYLGNGLSRQVIEDYWISLLELPRDSLKKTMINRRPSSSRKRGRRLLYGTCAIAVYRVHYLCHVFGAIQEYTGTDKPDWQT